MIRVVVVEDHALVRESLRRLLEGEPDVEVVTEAGDAETALESLRLTAADVVLLDLHLPGMSGIDAIRVLRTEFPKVRVLVLTAFPEHVAQAVQAGAAGYLVKTAGGAHLLAALRCVAQGSKVFHEAIAEGLSVGAVRPAGSAGLSPRELEVLRLMVRGLTNRAIARTLRIASRTADQHVHSIFVKTGARSRAEAVRYAVENRIQPA